MKPECSVIKRTLFRVIPAIFYLIWIKKTKTKSKIKLGKHTLR